MKPKLTTVIANINNSRLLIEGKTLKFEISQSKFNKIHIPLWQALTNQAMKAKQAKKRDFSFEIDKEELRHLYDLRETLENKKLEKKKEDIKPKQSAPSGLKAISIHAPHAYAICLGLKPEEYRTRSTGIRGWVLIHASQSQASDSFFQDYGIDIRQIKIARGAIIGAAYIEYCEGCSGDYAYGISQYKLFEKPLTGISGKQAIFWGAKSDREIQAFQEAWSLIKD